MASRTKTVERIGGELARGARTSDGVERISPIFRTITQLLLRARPVTVAEIAAATGRPEAEVSEALDSLAPIERDAEGRVLGLGLTLVPTPHRFRVEGRDLYTWCALDTLTFPSLLGVRAEVESPCQTTGTPVRITVTPDGISSVDPASAAVSVVPIDRAPNIRSAFCDHVHFFRSKEDAGAWLEQHPGGLVVTVAEGFALGRGFAEGLALRSSAE